MSNQFLKLRRSAVQGKIPDTSSLDLGELAINTYDGQLFLKKSGSQGELVIAVGSTGSYTGSFKGSLIGLASGSFSGSASGSFFGDGGGLTNIPASGIVGLNLSRIATGSITASVGTEATSSFRLISGSNTLLKVIKDGRTWIGNGDPVDTAYQLDVQGVTRILGDGSSSPGLIVGNTNGTNSHINLTALNTLYHSFSTGGTTRWTLALSTFFSNVLTFRNEIGDVVSFGRSNGTQNFSFADTAQGEGFTAVNSALMDLRSATKGFLPTRTNLTSNITSPAQGLLTYITASGNVEGLWQYRTGSGGWVQFLHNSSSIPASNIIGLNLSQIATGSVTASVNTDISASFRVTSGSNTIMNLTRDGQLWLGTGSFVNAGYQLDVLNADARINTINVGLGGGSVAGNTALGFEALKINSSSAGSNTGLGYRTLWTNTTGVSNTAIGFDALLFLNGTNYNTAIGTEAGRSMSGAQNVAIGAGAMRNANSGNLNVAIGYQSLNASGTGQYNTLIGAYSGMAITNGNQNTALGIQTLQGNKTGSDSVALGYQALYNATENRNIAIGSRAGFALTTGQNNIQIGYFSPTTGDGITAGSFNTIIGGQISGLAASTSNNIILADGQGNIRYQWDNTRNNFFGNTGISGSLFVSASVTASNALITGTITAQTLVVQTITSSIEYSSGSNIFGSLLTDTQRLTGSVGITGSLNLDGDLNFVSGSQRKIVYKSQGIQMYTDMNNIGNDIIMGWTAGSGLTGNTQRGIYLGFNQNGTKKDNAIIIGQGVTLNGTPDVLITRGAAVTVSASISNGSHIAPYGNINGNFSSIFMGGLGSVVVPPTSNDFIGTLIGGTINNQNLNTATILLGQYAEDGTYPAISRNTFIHTTYGSGSNVQGYNMIIAGGRSTGNSQPADVSFATTNVGSSGNTLQNLAIRWWIKGGTGTLTNRNINYSASSAAIDISGSLVVSGSIVLVGTEFNSTSSLTSAGITTISQLSTGSYTSCFYNYTVASASNARSGQVMTVWNGSNLKYTEVVTTDIGDTSQVLVSASLSTGLVRLQVSSSAGWTFKNISNLL